MFFVPSPFRTVRFSVDMYGERFSSVVEVMRKSCKKLLKENLGKIKSNCVYRKLWKLFNDDV